MWITSLLPGRPLHVIVRDDAKGLSLRSGERELSSAYAIIISVALILVVAGGHVYLPAAWGFLVPFGMLMMVMLLINIVGHIQLQQGYDRQYRFITIDAKGIHLQRKQGRAQQLIARASLTDLLLVTDGMSGKVFVNGRSHCHFELIMSPDDFKQVWKRMGKLLALPVTQTISTAKRTTYRLGEPLSSDSGSHTQHVYSFLRIEETTDRLTVKRSPVAGGSAGRYGRFIYTYDGHFHQMNTGVKVKMPIPSAKVERLWYTVEESAAGREDGMPCVATGELFLLTRDRQKETLLEMEYRTNGEVAPASLAMREQLGGLCTRLNVLIRSVGLD
jgi:hypothetical protein